jgi:hypothetical protein
MEKANIMLCRLKRAIIFLLVGLAILLYVNPVYAFRFVVIGDTRSDHSAHEQLVSRIAALTPKPVMMFNTGDITANGYDSEWEIWEGINLQLEINWSFDPPQYIGVVGNHDTHFEDWEFNWTYHLPGQQRYGDGKVFSIGYENALFVVLDSDNKNPSTSGLEDLLSQNASLYNWIFAFWHHPAYPFGRKDLDSSRRDWCPTLQEHGADIIFNGHAHYYARSYPTYMDGSDHPIRDDGDGIVQIITGGGGAPLYSVEPNAQGYAELLAYGEKTHHFIVIDIDGHSLHMEVIDIGGHVVDTLDIEKEIPIDQHTPAAPTDLRILSME